MKQFIILAVVMLSVNALSNTEHWENFKVKHGKVYKNPTEERFRFSVFLSNLKLINEHNAQYELGKISYTMGINQFADMTPEELQQKRGLQAKNMPKLNATPHVPDLNADVPSSIDWRSKGAVLPVKDQLFCQSCWAFSATGALEGQNFIRNNKLISLSEQQLVDCSRAYGNGDCSYGGFMTNAFDYIKDHGIESESSYPYIGEDGQCNENESKSVVRVTGYKEVEASEDALKQAVGTVGPISAAICSHPIDFYESGIFDGECPCDVKSVDHGILVVGYGEEEGTEYWIIKNSWGENWGDKGYFRLKRNANLCGLQLLTSYPLL